MDLALTDYNFVIDSLESRLREAFTKKEMIESGIKAQADSPENYKESFRLDQSNIRSHLARFYNNRAVIYAKRKDHSRACQEFKRAMDYGMDSLKDFIDVHCKE
ncbi:MAG: hypothetical protein AAF487_15320 [Bacteroidota bacterium]